MILVDTGYFIALADRADQLYVTATAWSAAVKEPLLVTEYVLWETVNHLSRPAQRDQAHDIAQAVRHEAQFIFLAASPELLEAGLTLHRQHRDKDWSLTDCISFHVMRQRRITHALAFDEHFEQAGFEALLRRDPA